MNTIKLKNYPEYIPVKVHIVRFENKIPTIKNTLTFIGPNEEKQIYSAIERYDSAESKKVLEKRYGKKWHDVLGIKSKSKKLRGGAEDLGEASVSIDISEIIEDLKIDEEKESIIESIEYEADHGDKEVVFIRDVLSDDDLVSTIKDKLYAYTGINQLAQNISYFVEGVTGETQVINLSYVVLQLNKMNRPLRVGMSLFNLYSKVESDVAGVPIDQSFIQKFVNEESLLIKDLHNYQLRRFVNFNRELYLFDMLSAIPNKINLLDTLSASTSSLDEFYYGFVTKYFPSIFKGSGMMALIRGTIKTDNIKRIIADSMSANEQRWALYNVDAEKVNKGLDIIPIVNSVTMRMMDKSSGQTQLFTSMYLKKKQKQIINIRNLFDVFSVNDIVPYVKIINDRDTLNKVDSDFKFKNMSDVTKWSLQYLGPDVIQFKCRTSDEIISNTYTDFATVTINSIGNIEVRANWKDITGANVKTIDKTVRTVSKYVLEKINGLGSLVFQRTNKRLPEYANSEVIVLSINANARFNGKNLTLRDYKLYRQLVRAFNKFIKINIEEMNNTRRLDFISLFYVRSRINFSRGIKLSQQGRNEILVNQSSDRDDAEIEGRVINISGEEDIKLTVKGVKGFEDFQIIVNTIARVLYLFSRPSEAKSKKVRENIERGIKLFNAATKKDSEFVSPDRVRRVQKLRKLQQIDPNLFQFTGSKGGKSKFYSRLCQGRQQPIILSDEEIKNTKLSKEQIIRLTNKTREGSFVNYGCDDAKYRFPGFIPKDKHPLGFCIPCCFKKNARDPENKNSVGYKILNRCLREERGERSLSTDDIYGKRESSNRRYILNWKSDEIEEGRFSELPSRLNKLLNNPQIIPGVACKLSGNILQIGSKCFLINGIAQSPNTFARIIGTVIHAKNKVTPNMAQLELINNFWDNCINNLKSHPQIFNILEGGKVKKKFGKLQNYLEYLCNDLFISDEWTTDLLSNHNGTGLNLNIIVMIENANSLRIKCDSNSSKFVGMLSSENRQTVLCIKSVKENNLIYYNYVTLVEVFEKSRLLSVTRSFDYDSGLTRVMRDMLIRVCEVEEVRDIVETSRLYRIEKNIEYMPTAEELGDLLPKGWQIIGNIIDKEIIKYIVLLGKKSKIQVLFPVNILSIPKPGDKIINNEPKVSLNNLQQFLTDLWNQTDLEIDIQSVVTNKGVAIGVLLNTNYFVPLSKFKPPKNCKQFEVEVLSKNIDYDYEKEEDLSIKQRRYLNQVRHVVKLELSKKLYFEKDKEFRKKRKISTTKIKSVADYEKLFKNLEDLNVKDYNQLVQIFTDHKEFVESDYIFNFDQKTINQMKKLINTGKVNKLREEVKKQLTDLVHIVPSNDKKLNDRIKKNKDSNILTLCSEKNKNKCEEDYCTYAGNSCKVLLDKKMLESIIDQIVDELVNNDLKRSAIFENNVSQIIDDTKFITREGQEIFKTISLEEN